MAHKKHTALGGDQGHGRQSVMYNGDNTVIIADSPSPDKSNLASPRQAAYLNSLRRILGLEKWNAAKTLLGIATPGTYDLTLQEADKLIKIIKLTLQGES